MAACGVRSNRLNSFSKNKLVHSIDFELYCIRKIDGVLSHPGAAPLGGWAALVSNHFLFSAKSVYENK